MLEYEHPEFGWLTQSVDYRACDTGFWTFEDIKSICYPVPPPPNGVIPSPVQFTFPGLPVSCLFNCCRLGLGLHLTGKGVGAFGSCQGLKTLPSFISVHPCLGKLCIVTTGDQLFWRVGAQCHLFFFHVIDDFWLWLEKRWLMQVHKGASVGGFQWWYQLKNQSTNTVRQTTTDKDLWP